MSFNKLDEEEKYRLGRNAGEVFGEEVNDLFRQFVEGYQTANPNFTDAKDESYSEGFWKGFIDTIEF